MPNPLRRLVPSLRLGGPALVLLLAATVLQAPPAPLVDLQARHSGPRVVDRAIPSVAATAARPHSRGHHTRLQTGRWFEVARLSAKSARGARMVGVTWRPGTGSGRPEVEMQVRTDRGWGRWTELEVDLDGPAGSERTAAARAGTQPVWVGEAQRVRVRVLSRGRKAPAGLELNQIVPGPGPALQRVNTTLAAQPPIIRWQQWGANPAYRDDCWKPVRGATQHGVVIHHTAGSNTYTKAQAGQVVRGIFAYHTRSRGWCDIGYNFLVSRYGQIFEGRAGGIQNQVRGAHAGVNAVNTYMTGVALMGNFERARPPRAMRSATVRLVAWRMESFYRHPVSRVTLGGQTLARISGHRNVKATACPGKYLYAWLPDLRRRVSERMGGWRSDIYRKWQRLGGSGGWVGVPYRGERVQAGGRTTIFTRARIYTSKAGTHEVHGPILRMYTSKGGELSRLGYPRSDVFKVKVGRRANFQGGCIIWNFSTGKVRVYYRST